MQSPPLLLLLLFYYYYLDSGLALPWCFASLAPHYPDHIGGMGSSEHPLSFVLAVVWDCPASHLPFPLTGPLALSGFAICLVRSPWPRRGCPWGHPGLLPSAIRLPALVSESDFEASSHPCHLQGDIYPPKAVATGPRQMVGPQGHPTGQLLPVFCLCSVLSAVTHWRCVWGRITRPGCLDWRPSSAPASCVAVGELRDVCAGGWKWCWRTPSPGVRGLDSRCCQVYELVWITVEDAKKCVCRV